MAAPPAAIPDATATVLSGAVPFLRGADDALPGHPNFLPDPRDVAGHGPVELAPHRTASISRPSTTRPREPSSP